MTEVGQSITMCTILKHSGFTSTMKVKTALSQRIKDHNGNAMNQLKVSFMMVSI